MFGPDFNPAKPAIDPFGYNDASFYRTDVAPHCPPYDTSNLELSAFRPRREVAGQYRLQHRANVTRP